MSTQDNGESRPLQKNPKLPTVKGARARKKAFPEKYRHLGNITEVSKIVGVTRGTYYGWLHKDPAYKQAFQEADDAVVEEVEEEVKQRSKGWEEPVLDKDDTSRAIKGNSLLSMLSSG